MRSTTDHNNDRCHRYSRTVILIMSAASIQACCSGLLCMDEEILREIIPAPRVSEDAATSGRASASGACNNRSPHLPLQPEPSALELKDLMPSQGTCPAQSSSAGPPESPVAGEASCYFRNLLATVRSERIHEVCQSATSTLRLTLHPTPWIVNPDSIES